MRMLMLNDDRLCPEDIHLDLAGGGRTTGRKIHPIGPLKNVFLIWPRGPQLGNFFSHFLSLSRDCSSAAPSRYESLVRARNF